MWALYDDLVFILKDESIQDIAMIEVGLQGENVEEENVMDWIEKNNPDQFNEIVSRHMFFAVLSNICQFVYHSLDSASRMKSTVALHLIRKPFLENLLIIEQIKIDEKGLIAKMYGNPNKFDPGKVTPDKKQEIINECIDLISGNMLLDASYVNELRFAKGNPNSIYALSNLATHLVTTRNASYKTASFNFNLIFSQDEEVDSQLDVYYHSLSYLLFYLAELCDQYLSDKGILNLENFKTRKVKRILAMMINRDLGEEESRLNTILPLISVCCPNCQKENKLNRSKAFSMTHNKYLLCDDCLWDILNDKPSVSNIYDQIYQ